MNAAAAHGGLLAGGSGPTSAMSVRSNSRSVDRSIYPSLTLTSHRRLTFNDVLDRIADMRGEQVEIALARPAGPTPLASLRGRVGRLGLGTSDEEGLVFVPFTEDGGTGLYLKAEDFTEAVDHGDLGLVVMSGGIQVSIELVG